MPSETCGWATTAAVELLRLSGPRRGGLRWAVLALLAAVAQPEELQGVEQQPEAGCLHDMQVHIMHGAMLQHHGGAAIDAGEVVLVAIGGGEQALATGQVTAANQAPLLQLTQVAIHRGQPHGLGALAQQGVQVLAGEFPVGPAQGGQQQLLAIARGGNLGGHGRAGRGGVR